MNLYWAARILSFFTGFISLSQEILWVRLVGFSFGGMPQAFGFVLGLYLLGIALGAKLGKRYCTDRYDLFSVSGTLLIIAGVCDILFPYAVVMSFKHATDGSVSTGSMLPILGVVVIIPCIIITSLIKSMVFPIAHHLGTSTQSDKVGSSVSKVYFANIIGSTLGPLVTGFFLLNVASLQTAMIAMATLTICTGSYCKFISDTKVSKRIAISAFLLVPLPFFLPQNLTHMLASNLSPHGEKVKQIVENRYGIIHVLEDKKGGDSVWGGNVYDGKVNIDFINDSNGISRIYGLSTMKPSYERILVIGLSAGAWTRVLQSFPGVRKIDVVELNPGYLEITKKYPELSPILSDSRIRIVFDDGRRWLKRNPTEKYDLIVMNTTFHWKAYSTYLLSSDFMQILKSHMNQGAVLAFNSTSLLDCFSTAAQVFQDVYKFQNFVVAGDAINVPNSELIMSRLSELSLDGQVLFHPGRQADKDIAMEEISGKFITFAQLQKENPQWPFMIITDQNLLSEYRRSYRMKKIFRILGFGEQWNGKPD